MVLFWLNITSGPLFGYVLFCQIFSVSLEYDPTIYHYIQSQHSPVGMWVMKVLLIPVEAWNLNFLKPVIPPFCLSERMRDIHVLALNSLSALYPIFLVVVLFLLIELHSRNYTIVRVAVKPFSIVLKRTSIKSVTGGAVLHTFAFLSTTKNLFILYAIIRIFHIFKSTDGSVYKLVLYTDPTIEYLSPTHIMFMIIPLLQCLFLVSVLLIIYPTRLYRCLSKFISPRKQLAVTIFVESLNSCFKDGLNGTVDYRACAGVAMFILPLFDISDLILVTCLFSRVFHSAYVHFIFSQFYRYLFPMQDHSSRPLLTCH